MLKAIEPVFELRFVERIGTKVVSTTINSFPATVGHKGTVRPLILNGQISNLHCKVDWNFFRQEYQVKDGTDGPDGRPSTNHIYFSDGGELERRDQAVLKTLNDRIYLLRTNEGTEGYLELFDPKKQEGGDNRSTLSLDPELVELKALVAKTDERAIEGLGVAIETKAIAQKNSAAIEVLDANIEARIKSGITLLKIAGADARLVVLGTIVISFAAFSAISLSFLHTNMDKMYEDSRSRSQHNERMKDPDRTTPERN